jgi:transposase
MTNPHTGAGLRGFANRRARRWPWRVTIVKGSDDTIGFFVLPRWWVVERSFGWLLDYRPLGPRLRAIPRTPRSDGAVGAIMTGQLARTTAGRAA